MAIKKQAERAVIVTTAHRGVFFGYTTESDRGETLRLLRARMIVYWGEDAHGLLGVASRGPGRGGKVTPAVDSLVLRNITSVFDVESAAAGKIEAEPWG